MWHDVSNMAATESSTTIRVGNQGRIVIPAEIRDALEIRDGDTIVATVEDGRLILATPRAILAAAQAAFDEIPHSVSLVDELLRERREDARQEQRETGAFLAQRSSPA